jgi:hypothetical protein
VLAEIIEVLKENGAPQENNGAVNSLPDDP